MSDTDTKPQQNPHSRLCHVIKSDNFDGYGFNLHAEKGKPGQYIGKVDEGSPAEHAGLRQGDRILEVNGVSIANENHKQVVQRIKALADETKLLVVDPEDEELTPSIVTDNNSNASSKTASDATTASANNGQAHIEPETEDTMNMNINSNTNINTTNNTNNKNGTANANANLNLNMTAAELRAKLAAKKKFDPRKENMDFKKKFDTVQKL